MTCACHPFCGSTSLLICSALASAEVLPAPGPAGSDEPVESVPAGEAAPVPHPNNKHAVINNANTLFILSPLSLQGGLSL